jgi:hypothetical protein
MMTTLDTEIERYTSIRNNLLAQVESTSDKLKKQFWIDRLDEITRKLNSLLSEKSR